MNVTLRCANCGCSVEITNYEGPKLPTARCSTCRLWMKPEAEAA